MFGSTKEKASYGGEAGHGSSTEEREVWRGIFSGNEDGKRNDCLGAEQGVGDPGRSADRKGRFS